MDFFFILSGFVLSNAYDRRFAHGLRWASFMKLRLRRLWPTMATGIALGAALHGEGRCGLMLALRTVAALLFLPLPIATVHMFVLNGVEWSLFFELCANAAHGGPLKNASGDVLARLLLVSAALLFSVAYLHGDLTVGHVKAGWIGGFARSWRPTCSA